MTSPTAPRAPRSAPTPPPTPLSTRRSRPPTAHTRAATPSQTRTHEDRNTSRTAHQQRPAAHILGNLTKRRNTHGLDQEREDLSSYDRRTQAVHVFARARLIALDSRRPSGAPWVTYPGAEQG